jgi:hypothetical protein
LCEQANSAKMKDTIPPKQKNTMVPRDLNGILRA